MDNLTKSQRSYSMSRIRSKGTNLGKLFFGFLDENNIAYTKYPKLFGKPDCQIGNKLLIFIDSDFWHGWRFQQWKERLPQDYWVEKIERNIKRDKQKFRILRKDGYKVLRVWSHQLKDKKKTIKRIVSVNLTLRKFLLFERNANEVENFSMRRLRRLTRRINCVR